MDLTITTLAERPELESSLWQLGDVWPEFMKQDPIANLYFNRVDRLFPHLVLVATTLDRPDAVVARGFSIPFALRDDELPDAGWDAVIRWGIEDHIDGRAPTHLSALEISIDPAIRGQGNAGQMILAMRGLAAGMNLENLVAPVRPNMKHMVPDQSIDAYAFAKRDDGLPLDPWLRTHVRLGGKIIKVAPRSMVVTGSLDEWRQWTGEPFDTPGPTRVQGALAPVTCDQDRNLAVYVEPNVWVRHRVS